MMNRSEKSPELTVADFMPKFEPEAEVEIEEDDTSALERLAAALGATVVDR